MIMSTKRANAKLENFSHNVYSLAGKYQGCHVLMPVINNVTNQTETSTYNRIMARVRTNRFRKNHPIKNRNYQRNWYHTNLTKASTLDIDKSIELGKMTSGGYYFPSIIKGEIHYLKLQNIINYLDASKQSLRLNLRKNFKTNKLFALNIASVLDDRMKDVLFCNGESHIAVVDTKAIYLVLKEALNSSRMAINKKRTRIFLKDLMKNYSNEITGVTDLKAKLIKHNARIERLSQQHSMQSKVEKNQKDLGSKISSKLKQLEAFKAKIESDAKDEVAKIRLNAKKEAEKADAKIKHVSALNTRLQNIYQQILDLDA